MVLFWRQARSAQIDALLCFLILISLSAFEAFRAGEARGRPAGLLFWGAAAAATLAKGPVGLLIPLLIALLTLGLDRDLRSWRRFAPFSGPALFLALTGAWAAGAGAGGEYSVFGALRKHFLERAVHGMHHAQPPWYYLTTLPVGLLPWTGLVIGGLALAWRERRDPRMRLLLVWSATVVLMFSISTEKRDLYVLPAFPAFALLATGLAAALADREGRAPSRRWVTVSLGIFGGVAVLAGAALPFASRYARLPVDLTGPCRVLAVPLVLGGIAILIPSARGRWRAAILATAAVLAVSYLVGQSVVFPALNPIKSVRRLAVEAARETAGYRAAGGKVLELGLRNEPRAVAFYSKGVYPVDLQGPEELERAVAGAAPVYALLDRGSLAALPAATRGRLRILTATRTSDAEILLVRSEPPPPGR
jgi:4-amino-4-deoxy-L-arabinose transferase-like glycosyltransferase